MPLWVHLLNSRWRGILLSALLGATQALLATCTALILGASLNDLSNFLVNLSIFLGTVLREFSPSNKPLLLSINALFLYIVLRLIMGQAFRASEWLSPLYLSAAIIWMSIRLKRFQVWVLRLWVRLLKLICHQMKLFLFNPKQLRSSVFFNS